MTYNFLTKAVSRHLAETQNLVDQLTDDIITKEPVISGRPLGEVLLHLLRSLEYYSRGLADDVWEALPYTLENYSTAENLQTLYNKVKRATLQNILNLTSESLEKTYTHGNRLATGLEILLEMLEHSIQHRGQVLVYYRLVGIEPAKIEYII
jgi:uncharacterized damage-inducible protein DinB